MFVEPTVNEPEPTNAAFGTLLKFVPVSVGVFVQLGPAAPDTST